MWTSVVARVALVLSVSIGGGIIASAARGMPVGAAGNRCGIVQEDGYSM